MQDGNGKPANPFGKAETDTDKDISGFGSDIEVLGLFDDAGRNIPSYSRFGDPGRERIIKEEIDSLFASGDWSFERKSWMPTTPEKAQKQADPKGANAAVSRCCANFLTIKIQRHTAVMLKNAVDIQKISGTGVNNFLPIIPNFVVPESIEPEKIAGFRKRHDKAAQKLFNSATVRRGAHDKDSITNLRGALPAAAVQAKKDMRQVHDDIIHGMPGDEQAAIAMLMNLDWRGIVGTMTAIVEHLGCYDDKGNYIPSRPTEYPSFTTETFEPKGPPQLKSEDKQYKDAESHIDENKCLAVPDGTYKIQTVNTSNHSTYNFDKAGMYHKGGQPLRGVRISNHDVPPERGIDIHVGGNAGFTVGCIMLAAPEVVYRPFENKNKKPGEKSEQQLTLDAYRNGADYTEYSKKHSWPDINKFIGADFGGSSGVPSWVQRVSLIKVTELIELMEDTLNVGRGKLPKDLDCIKLVIENPNQGIFEQENIVILETLDGPPAKNNSSVTIDSLGKNKAKEPVIERIELINDIPHSYRARIDGRSYLVTTYPRFTQPKK